MKKNPTQKVFMVARAAQRTKEIYFWGITPKPKIGIF
jgi:hypothetical protein